MTSSAYIKFTLFFVVMSLVSMVSINLAVNDFGLFYHRQETRIWAYEKTSKYLMSFRYIPENFDSVIIGPSVSANMDTRILAPRKIYNLSMNSGNITELSKALNNVIDNGQLDSLIVCLYPYLTKNSGIKGRQIDEKEYLGSLYSIIPVRMYLRRLRNLVFPEKDVFHQSEWGFNDSNILKRDMDFTEFVENRRRNPREKIHIDSQAVEELNEILKKARTRNIKIVAYYFPMFGEYLDVYKKSGAWYEFQSVMQGVLERDDVVIDMNIDRYNYIRNDYASYSDGHLSDLGAERVLQAIDAAMKEHEL